MKSFKQHIFEIFDSAKPYTSGVTHPDLAPEESDEDTLTYIHTPRDQKYNKIPEKEIRTTFMRTGSGPHEWDMEFSIGGKFETPSTLKFPEEVTRKVFDHAKHFMDTHKETHGAMPSFIYGTRNSRKDRLFQLIAQKLGVKATNKLKVSNSPTEEEE